MADVVTHFGALNNIDKGGVEIIDDDPRNYVFSNVFEVAANALPYERIAVGKNFEYVIEAARAEGGSRWFACAHDEFVLCMDGTLEVHLLRLADPAAYVDPKSQGAVLVADETPDGKKMGRIVLGRGHQALLPGGAAYRFHADAAAAILFQTIAGPLTVEKWAEICQTEAA